MKKLIASMTPSARVRAALALWLLVIVCGCGGSPAVQYYTLNPLAPATSGSPALTYTVVVGPVAFPDMLDRPQIATRNSDNRVDYAEFHQWAGRLREDFKRVLIENLGAILADKGVAVVGDDFAVNPALRLALQAQQFDGRPGDSLLLNASWTLQDLKTREVLAVRKSLIREPVPAGSYAELAAAHSRAIEALSREIALEIRSRR